jgi:hypothetical protein
VASSATSRIPRWSGTVLADGIIQDDATNVGIGTAPVTNQKLTVSGKTTTTNLQMTTGAANGLVLQSDASGNGTWVNANTLTTNNLYNTNGTLTSARTITQGSNALTITNNGTQNTTINLASTGDFDIQKNGVSALKVQDDGNVGINQSTPLAGLHIKGVGATFDAHIRLESAGASTDYANILYDGNTKFRNFGANNEFQFRNSANNIRMRLFDNGDLTIAGTLTQSSDQRLKKDIFPIGNALDILTNIKGYTYHWLDEKRGSALQSGVIAQELEASLPHLVRTDEEGKKSVNYTGMIPYLLEAVKELKKENETLRKLVEKLLEDKK